MQTLPALLRLLGKQAGSQAQDCPCPLVAGGDVVDRLSLKGEWEVRDSHWEVDPGLSTPQAQRTSGH